MFAPVAGARLYKIVNRKKLLLTRLADALGWAVLWPKKLLPAPPPLDPREVTSILLIRTAYIGDVVMTLPLLGPLRRGFPRARITFLTSQAAAPLLLDNPLVDEVLAYDPFWFYPRPKGEYLAFARALRRRRFDLVIEARGDIREILLLACAAPAKRRLSYDVGGGGWLLSDVVPYPGLKHKVEYHLDLARHLGCPVEGLDWRVRLTPEEEAQVDQALARVGVGGPFVAFHPGSRLELKRWAHQRYTDLADRLIASGGPTPLFLGAASETAQVREILGLMQNPAPHLAGELNLRQLAGVLGRARLLVCNDSAPMHIAAAMGTGCLALFGPSKSVETAPFGPGHRVAELEMPCRAACDESTCLHTPRHECMERLTVEPVWQALQEMLGPRE